MMPRRSLVLGTLLLAAAMHSIPSTAADADALKTLDERLGEPYEGVVTAQTVTVAGNDFYQYFISLWRDKPLSQRYAIAIRERPSARHGNLVWVEFNHRRVFQTTLPTARSAVRAASAQAVDSVYEAVVNADVQRMLFRELDLGPEEI